MRTSPLPAAVPTDLPAGPVDGYRPGAVPSPEPGLRKWAPTAPQTATSTPQTATSTQPLKTPRCDSSPTPEAIALAEGMVSGRDLPSDVREGAVRDLACLPLAWLRRLDDEGLMVAVLQDGQNLADLDLLPEMTPERCRKDFAAARALAEQVIDEENRALSVDPSAPADDFSAAMARRWLPDVTVQPIGNGWET